MRLGIGLSLLIFLGVHAAAQKPKLHQARATSERIDIEATVYTGPAEVQPVVGHPLPEGFVVVEVKVRPREEGPIRISPDDFTLLSHRDGQKSSAFQPTQIAGKGALVVTQVQGRGSIGAENPGPWFGGNRGRIGSPTGSITETRGAIQEDKNVNQPLLDALKEKALPDKETADPVSGLLYFSIEGKFKKKELSLIYKGAAGRLVAEFKEVGAK
jgi:hypothetical protein